MTKQSKRIQVKETKQYYGDFYGTIESIISQLQSELDDGWEGIEEEYERDYGDCHDHTVYYLYKHREENDKEYARRMLHLEKLEQIKKEKKIIETEQRRKEYEKLKKEFANEN
jgi:hypothetical protein